MVLVSHDYKNGTKIAMRACHLTLIEKKSSFSSLCIPNEIEINLDVLTSISSLRLTYIFRMPHAFIWLGVFNRIVLIYIIMRHENM